MKMLSPLGGESLKDEMSSTNRYYRVSNLWYSRLLIKLLNLFRHLSSLLQISVVNVMEILRFWHLMLYCCGPKTSESLQSLVSPRTYISKSYHGLLFIKTVDEKKPMVLFAGVSGGLETVWNILGLHCQKQINKAKLNNCILQFPWDVVTCFWLWSFHFASWLEL